MSVSIIKVQMGRNLHDSLVKKVQQLHHHLSVSIIKVQKGISESSNCNIGCKKSETRKHVRQHFPSMKLTLSR